MPLMSCTPFTNNGRAYTGCVATVMAQLIRYHEYPVTGYNYSMMANNIPYWDTSSPSATEVSKLMYNAAVSVNSSYDCTGTGAASNLNDILNAFKNTFGYSTSITKGAFNSNTVKSEIYWSRPVLLTGYTTKTGFIFHTYSGGHIWIADGYRDILICGSNGTGNGYLYLNMNWGWGGEYNGWFSSNNVNSGNGNYQYKREMITQISP